jgi:L-ascorbate metabolism protein UlaG (beta-lactamase superfamily)
MLSAFQKDGTFLADVIAKRSDQENFHLWWLGQSGFLIQWQGKHLLLDPYLSNSLTKKYESTDKPHVRMTELVVDPARLNFIDVVTSSHNHTDHLDGETLIPLFKANPKLQFVVPEANREFAAQRAGVPSTDLHGLDAGQFKTVAGFEIHGVPAAHETIERDKLGRMIYLGYVIRFGPWVVYHSGDTVHYEGMAETLRQWRIDMALLPVNGRGPERRVAGNLWGREAAQLAKDVGVRIVIPCHYDMFEFNTATPKEFVTTCENIGQRYAVLRNGEGWSSSTIR